MRIQPTNMSIAEIRDAFRRKELVVNRDYQRNSGVWPVSAKSYFIDTVLMNFPFPKVYFTESLDRQNRRIRREIVDGQQRIMTIIDFINDDFSLNSTSKSYSGNMFSTLEEDIQVSFLSYSVPVDMILSADSSEILEMFRRINTFTIPLNKAEQRHSQWQGQFKWAVNEIADNRTDVLENYGVFTQRQIVRMADAEFIAEIFEIILKGIVNKQDSAMERLYKDFDAQFARRSECMQKIDSVFDVITTSLSSISGTFLTKSYAFHSLITALIHNKFGPIEVPREPGHELVLPAPLGDFMDRGDGPIENLLVLARAHEAQEVDGPYGEYVRACLSTTHRVNQRFTRTKWLVRALKNDL
jgi:hypothetical protein